MKRPNSAGLLVFVPVMLTISFVTTGIRPAGAQARVLTSNAENGFRQFIAAVEAGRAGADVIQANVAMLKDTARVELKLRDGGRRTFELSVARSDADVHSRFFTIIPGPDATRAQAQALVSLLDSAFDSDPFSMALLEVSTHPLPSRSIAEAWRSEGIEGARIEVVRRLVSPHGRTFTLAILMIHLLGLALCILITTALKHERGPQTRLH